jgi:hypothetical protein
MNLNDLPDMSDALKQVQMYEAKKKGDGDLANNAVPYDKVTKADIIVGAVGRDEKGGKAKPKGHDCAKLVKYAPDGSVKESFETVPEMHTLLEDGTVTHYDIVSLDGNMTYFNVPVEDLEIVISEKHEHFVNYDKNAEVLGEAMSSYDRNRQRAAQRAAARNAARDAGKTGAVPGVGYVTPRRERETYVDSAGVTRHKSGAKNEEVEIEDFFMIDWAEEVINTLAENDEIDQLSDEELVNLFETAFLEMSDGPDDLLEMVEIFEDVVLLDEAVDLPPALAAKRSAMKARRDAAAEKKEKRFASSAMQRADIKSRASRLKAAAGAAAEKVKSGLKSAAKKVSSGASSVSNAMDKAKGKQSDSSDSSDDKKSGGSTVVHAVPVVAVAGRSAGGGRSSSGGGATTKKSSGPSTLRKVGSLIKKGVKKAVGKTARLVSRGSEKLAKRLGENYEQIETMMESGLFTMSEIENVVCLDEKTAMAKRGYDETKLRKPAGGGEAADRATALENRPTYGDANKAKQRQNYARKQRGDFRNTASSSPGLHGYGHKATNDADKAKQAARGAQRGALTPKEKKDLGRG